MMDAKAEVRQAQEHLARAQAKLEACERIRVPDGIRFLSTFDTNWDFGLGLCFGNNQNLAYSPTGKTWAVGVLDNRKPMATPLYLTPCSRSDLKAGDWAICSTGSNPGFTNKCRYKLILSPDKYAYCNGEDVTVTEDDWDFWWKVTE